MGKSKDDKEMLFCSELKGIVDQCHVEDLILVPAGHYWTRKSGLVDYYQPEWDCDGYTEKFVDGKTYTNGISYENGVSQLKKKPEFKTAEECKSALEKAVIRRCMADVE